MQRILDGGLILRSLSEGHAFDQQGLPAFYSEVFGEAGDDEAASHEPWVADLGSGRHPTTTQDDLWLVIDPARQNADDPAAGIVSAVLLIPQEWRYEGVPFSVGRVELVATRKEYRRRGLVRAQFEAAHERSHALGHHVQAITGIPHYYRRYGYAMAMDLGSRGMIPLATVPALKEDEPPRYTLRLATPDDAVALATLDKYHSQRFAIAFPRSVDVWHYELTGRTDGATMKLAIAVIVDVNEEVVGYLSLRASWHTSFVGVQSYVVGENASYLETFDDAMRWCKAYIEDAYQQREPKCPDYLYFDSGHFAEADTLFRLYQGGQTFERTYTWYLRVEDMAGFLNHIAPALERRLVGSAANRYTGELKIGFYNTTGIRMVFESGHLKVEPLILENNDDGAHASFPFHTFLNLVFGHRTYEELFHILPDVRMNARALVVLQTLFPKKAFVGDGAGMSHAHFQEVLLTVVGQAFTAAGYTLAQTPIQWADGQFRFTKVLEGGAQAAIAFQHLAYHDTEWSAGAASRFRVMLSRGDGVSRDLSALVVEDFGVAILPSGQHWWTYRSTGDLGQALAEAGHLIIGYGMPWLSGDLVP